MSTAKEKVPADFGTVTPHLVLKNAIKAIEFYKQAFGAEEISRLMSPDGRVMHADIKIGNSHVMLCDEFPDQDCGVLSPETLKNAHAVMHMFVEDVDQAFEKAIKAGAKAIMPPQDMFWGDRYGRLNDPFGQPWSIATHKEDLTHEEINKRMSEFACAPAGAK